jgi:hypothetical protein
MRRDTIHAGVTRIFVAIVASLVASAAWAQEPSIRLQDNPRADEFEILIGPVDLPVMQHMTGGDHHGMMVLPPVQAVEIPFDAWIYGFRYEVTDADGKPVPSSVLHHLNVIDPAQRDLFLPISYRVAAVGSETGAMSLPWLLFGHGVHGGQHLVIAAMLHNPTMTAYHGVTVKFIFEYVKTGRPWPLFPVYTFQMDVAFPVGDKDFDLPPGRSSKSWEGSPSVSGRIIALGGHMHQYADGLTLEDVTTGTRIWEGKPILNDRQQLVGVTLGRLYWKLGVGIEPDHTYRVTVTYDNPTGATIPKGGMGVIGGIFMPSGAWPRADTANELYQLDREHYLRQVRGSMAEIMRGAPVPADQDHAAHDHGAR